MSEASILQAIYDQLFDAIERAKPHVESKSETYRSIGTFEPIEGEEYEKIRVIRAHPCHADVHPMGTMEGKVTCWPVLDDFAKLLQRIKQYKESQ